MKRFIRVVALCMAFAFIFTSYVSASSFDNIDYFPLLDYSTPNNSGSSFVEVSPGSTAFFDFPAQRFVGFIDIVCSIVGNPDSVYAVYYGTKSYLNIVNISGNMYRIYGSVAPQNASRIEIGFSDTYINWVDFHQFNLYGISSSFYSDVARLAVTYDGNTSSFTMPGPRESVSFAHGNLDPAYQYDPKDYLAYVYLQNWTKYDFVDVFLTVTSQSSTSVTAFVKDISLPFEVSYIDHDGRIIYPYSQYEYVEGEYGQTDIILNSSYSTYYYVPNSAAQIRVRVDLRGVRKDIGFVPVVCLRGTSGLDTLRITLSDYCGFVETNSVNPLFYYFQSLQNKLSSLFGVLQARQDAMHRDQLEFHSEIQQITMDFWDSMSESIAGFRTSVENWFTTVSGNIKQVNQTLYDFWDSMSEAIAGFRSSVENWFLIVSDQLDQLLHPDTSESQEFEDDIASQATEMEDISETLDSVTKPPLDDFDISIDEYFEGENTVAFASPLGAFFENSIFIVMFLMSMIAVTVSYGLYGKR